MRLLQGVRVLECATLPTGDNAGRILGDLGADVIKIEQPGVGDYLRDVGLMIAPPHHSMNHLFSNRNKRSVTLNLRSDEGRDIFYSLLAVTDIFVDGYAGDACARLGIGYDDQRQVKPDIIYCQASGFGVRGPYGQIPTHGYMMGGVAGALNVEVGDDNLVHEVPAPLSPYGPFFPGQIDGPIMGAVWAALTAVAALQYRTTVADGVRIDCSGADAVIACQVTDATADWNFSRMTLPENALPPIVGTDPRERPKYNFYMTKDGRFLMFCAIEHKFWDNFCRAVAREDLLQFKDLTAAGSMDYLGATGAGFELVTELDAIFRTRTLLEWVELASTYDIPISPINRRMELLEDPHLRARDIISDTVHPVAGPFTTVGWPAVVEGHPYETARPAPELGEHTDEVLSEFGYSADQIASLRANRVV